MLNEEIFLKIKYMHKSRNMTVAQLSQKYNISEGTVRSLLKKDSFSARKPREISTILDPYKNIIKELFQECESFSAQQIYQHLVNEGYKGSYNTVQRYVLSIRPVKVKSFLSLHFESGDAVQVDFGSCGYISCGSINRRLSVLVMTLCYSRLMYAEFILSERQEHFLSCIKNGFEFFQGVPKRVIVDNCKCAVIKNSRYEETVFNNRFFTIRTTCYSVLRRT